MEEQSKAPKSQVVDDEQLAALKAKHGDLYELAVELEEEGRTAACICKKPGRPQFSRFARDMQSDAYRAMNNLFFDCLVAPVADEMRALFDQHPGLAVTFGNKLLVLAKLNLEVLEKKL